MSLSIALESALSSLRVNQQSIGVITENISNANSVNYTRQEVERTARVTAGRASGVEISSIARAVDDFLVKATREQLSDYSFESKKSELYGKLELFLGEPGADNSIDFFINDFFNSITEAANNADQVYLRRDAVETGARLANFVSELATNLEQFRFDIDLEIKRTIENFNTLSRSLFDLNKSIKENLVNNADNNANFDQRDVLLEKMSEITNINVVIAANGTASVSVPRGDIVTDVEYVRISYTPAASTQTFIDDGFLGAATVQGLNDDGTVNTSRSDLYDFFSDSNETSPVDNVRTGSLRALLDLRGSDIPEILTQLDEFASTFRDAFNAIHNDGGGYPPAGVLTGTQLVNPTDLYEMSGEWRIAVVNADGSPVADPYDPDSPGFIPLTINLSTLVSTDTQGGGVVDVQTIIDEINQYYGVQQTKVTVGPADDVKLAAVSSSVSITAATSTVTINAIPNPGDSINVGGTVFTFANAPLGGNQFLIKSNAFEQAQEIVRVLNLQAGAPVNTATYEALGNQVIARACVSGSAANGSLNINVAGAPTLAGGGVLAGGVDAGGQIILDLEARNIGKYDNLTIEIDPGYAPGITTSLPAPGDVPNAATSFTSFTLDAGERARSNDGFGGNSFIFDLPAGAALQEGDTFQVSIPILVTETDTSTSPPTTNTYTDVIQYQVTIPGEGENIRNTRYQTLSANVDNTFSSDTNSAFLRAELVDANGKVVDEGEEGYLRIRAVRGGTGLVIDEMDSLELGNQTDSTQEATNRQLSHFFGLNDFFISTSGVNELEDAAVNLAVADRFQQQSSLFSLGGLVQSKQPADPGEYPYYTYELGFGNDEVGQRLINLGIAQVSFDQAGFLPPLTTTFSAYVSEILSFTASRVNRAQLDFEQAGRLRDSLFERMEAISGVNIDEELANTVLFQNNYQASARLITVIAELFDTLVDSF